MTEFRDDLKKLYRIAGCDGQQVAFLLTDNQIASEGFLEDINNMLNSGAVPGAQPSRQMEIIKCTSDNSCCQVREMEPPTLTILSSQQSSIRAY